MTDSHKDDLNMLQAFLRLSGLDNSERRDAREGPNWRAVRCRFTSAHMDHEAADAEVTGFAGRSGWLSRTDRHAVFGDGRWRPVPEHAPFGTGRPLAAELLMEDGRSVSLRHLDGERWLRIEAAEGEGEETFLARDVEYLSVLTDVALRYAVYWRRDGDRYRQVASRFTGFIAKKSGE